MHAENVVTTPHIVRAGLGTHTGPVQGSDTSVTQTDPSLQGLDTTATNPSQNTALQREAALTARPNLISTDSSVLLKKYSIEPSEVKVVSSSQYLTNNDLDEISQNKETLLIKLLEAHEHALKNKRLQGSKFSGRQYASNLEFKLSIGKEDLRFWNIAGNFEMNIAELICG